MQFLGDTMSEPWKKWVEIAKIVSVDPKAIVKCPVCGVGQLLIWDEPAEHDPSRWERHMRCPVCGATNSILMSQN
jgi:hypothetical protein